METKRLFVGNLPFDVTEGELFTQFGPYGARHVYIVEDKGIAFIEIDADRLRDAVDEKHDSELGGRRLTVNEARPRD